MAEGASRACFCDIAIASDNVYFSQPEIKLGCFPPISLVALPEIIGHKKAVELILTGNKLSATEAYNLGLVNYVFSRDEFQAKSEEIINSITSNSASVIKTTLSAYKKINYQNFEEKLSAAEKIYIDELMKLEDAEEGLKSFLEKRAPVWKDN
ncbi:MAG: enoyl-CoA hydratase-related protein [Ignavibacteriales bacterium]|nr:enoyl-CoA hydratase-related protein [Ignavibacteriales bacterium]